MFRCCINREAEEGITMSSTPAGSFPRPQSRSQYPCRLLEVTSEDNLISYLQMWDLARFGHQEWRRRRLRICLVSFY